MKKDIDNLKETYNICKTTGNIKEKIIDIELIKSLKNISEKSLEFIEKNSKNIKKNSSDWTFVFRDYYESLRMLIESIMLFDGIQADNHQCKNAYICFKHPELDLEWEFLETIRLKRNAINYRGLMINYDEWNILKLKLILHINRLKKEIEINLKRNLN